LVSDLFEDFIDSQTRRPISKENKAILYKKQRGKCNYCGRKLGMAYFQHDHKTPLSRGGTDRISNLQLLCGPCNTRKGDMTDGECRRRYKLTPTRKAKGPPDKVIRQQYFEEISKSVAATRAKQRRQDEDDWFF